MSLKYIVPTLGLMAVAASPVMAADVGGLTINGYVDTILEINSFGEDIAPSVDNDGEPDEMEIDFTASAQLEIGYQIGSAISANIELYYRDNSRGAGSPGTGHTLDVEQAYIEWAVSDQVSLAMGKFHNWIGWEGNDTPELYRVNFSHHWAWTGSNVTGLGVGIDASEQVDVGIYLVDAIWGQENENVGGAIKEQGDLAIGANVTVKVEGIGLFDFDLGYDINASIDDGGEEASILIFSFNGEIDAIREDTGLLFFWDLLYVDFDIHSSMGLMIGANWDLKTDTPMSATLMISYLDPNDDDDIVSPITGAGGEDDEVLEIAVALLTNPTKDENFALNFELRYISRGDAYGDDADEVGIFVEALAVIP